MTDFAAVCMVEPPVGASSVRQRLETVRDNTWADDVRILALLATGNHVDEPVSFKPTPRGSFFKVRIEQAGFNWPPHSPIKYPAKDW